LRKQRLKLLKTKKPLKVDEPTIELIESTEGYWDDDGWAFLGDVGNLVKKTRVWSS
jgi:hypothetical protein